MVARPSRQDTIALGAPLNMTGAWTGTNNEPGRVPTKPHFSANFLPLLKILETWLAIPWLVAISPGFGPIMGEDRWGPGPWALALFIISVYSHVREMIETFIPSSVVRKEFSQVQDRKINSTATTTA